MSQGSRSERVADQLRSELGQLLAREVHDPGIGFITLTRVQISGDLQQARVFSEMLEQSLRRYQNRAIETAKIIEELIQLAKDMRQAALRGEALGLSDDEVAFYDALETNDSAVKVMGDDALRTIARELVATVRANVTIDWTVRDNVRAMGASRGRADPRRRQPRRLDPAASTRGPRAHGSDA